jgi:hypothetical protein
MYATFIQCHYDKYKTQQSLRILTFCIPMLQTHISENVGEVAAIQELYPECRNYADVYDRAGLLTNKVMSI